jgi:ribosomal protein S18 acetylase RimI-like enzyme
LAAVRSFGSIGEGKDFFLVAEVDGRVIASSDINRQRGYEKHVSVVGIVIKGGFRDLGIGTAMMRAPVEVAKKIGLKVLTLSAFAGARRAIHVYESWVCADRLDSEEAFEGRQIHK